QAECIECLITLALSYIALAKTLQKWSNNISICLGWYRRAFEEVANKSFLFPVDLKRAIWKMYLHACLEHSNKLVHSEDAEILRAQKNVNALRLQRLLKRAYHLLK